jgi:hypothetical protein
MANIVSFFGGGEIEDQSATTEHVRRGCGMWGWCDTWDVSRQMRCGVIQTTSGYWHANFYGQLQIETKSRSAMLRMVSERRYFDSVARLSIMYLKHMVRDQHN